MKEVILINYINIFIHEYNSFIKYNRRERIKDKSICVTKQINNYIQKERIN